MVKMVLIKTQKLSYSLFFQYMGVVVVYLMN